MYKIYGSFSENPGIIGYNFFNKQFKHNNINACYIPFRINDIQLAILSIKILNICGIGISMPFKTICMQYLDTIDNTANAIGAVNTIINKNNILYGYNTDWIAIYDTIKETDKPIYILGNGGYAKAAIYACNKLNRKFIQITRQNWNMITNIYNSIIINCTPVINIIENNNIVLYANVNTETGKKLAFKQACEQYYLYTGSYPDVSIY